MLALLEQFSEMREYAQPKDGRADSIMAGKTAALTSGVLSSAAPTKSSPSVHTYSFGPVMVKTNMPSTETF